jgi:hypothetical protein
MARDWIFDVSSRGSSTLLGATLSSCSPEFDVFNRNALTRTELEKCAGDLPALCFAEGQAHGQPIVALTTDAFTRDHFSVNRGSTSVITTADWRKIAPPSMYEYLMYSVIVQSIVIHLNAQCSGLPERSFVESRESYGGLFEFEPRRYAMKPAILVAHLTPAQEQLLLNCFGPEYLKTTSALLSLDWMRSEAVKRNLQRNFGVNLDSSASPSQAR